MKHTKTDGESISNNLLVTFDGKIGSENDPMINKFFTRLGIEESPQTYFFDGAR